MYESLTLFSTSAALARHAGARQAQAAIDVANADTPGFRAQTLPDFEGVVGGGLAMRQTRPGHLGGAPSGLATAIDAPGEASPDGNNVSIESEMFASAQASREHGQALAIWRHATGLIRTALGG